MIASIPQYVPQVIAAPFQWAWRQRIYLVKEAAGASLTAFFLHCITERYLNHPPRFSSMHPLDELCYLYLKQQKPRQFSFIKLYHSIAFSPFLGDVVFSPLLEEIIFRSLLPKMIGFFQKKICLNQNDSSTPTKIEHTPREACTALHLRVHVSALMFALAHSMISLRHRRNTIIQISSNYLGGVVSGYLIEKYGFLAPGLLAHGLHNFLTLQGIMLQGRRIIASKREWYQFRHFWNDLTGEQRSIFKWMAVNKIAFLLLGLLPIERYVANGFRKMI